MGEVSATEEKKEKREDERSMDTNVGAGFCVDDQGESRSSQHRARESRNGVGGPDIAQVKVGSAVMHLAFFLVTSVYLRAEEELR